MSLVIKFSLFNYFFKFTLIFFFFLPGCVKLGAYVTVPFMHGHIVKSGYLVHHGTLKCNRIMRGLQYLYGCEI